MPFRRILLTAVAVLLSVPPAAAQVQSPADAYDGAAALGLALRRLGTTARVLHIGAHPDDENTALFAPLALGRGVDAAYLSLTRGEGGQNGIGPELGIPLGVIRSEELLSARRLDGGDQFFTRAIDYGYSKNAEEAFRHWPRDSVVADVVAIIRRYRPDVVASVWSGTPRDGHGQHQAAGLVAREAVLAAGDPARFPEQVAAGLRAHSPALYYRSAWFREGSPDVELNTGALDPLLGASYHQVAMASRSRHRSQDQGRLLDPGPRSTGFDRVDPAEPVAVGPARRFGRYPDRAASGTASLFEGVDTLLSQRAVTAFHDRAQEGAEAVRLLRDYERLVSDAVASYAALAPWELVPGLSTARDRLAAAEAVLDADAGDRAPHAVLDLRHHLAEERADLEAALLLAANVKLDAVADDDLVVPGQSFRLELSAWNGGPDPVVVEVRPLLPGGWRFEEVDGPTRMEVGPGSRAVATFAVTVAADAEPTSPYYLDAGPAPEDMYAWPTDPAVRGLPFAPAPVRGEFRVAGDRLAPSLRVERDASWIGVDRRNGEFRRPVKVVPAATVTVEPDLAVIRLSARETRQFDVRVRALDPAGVAGELRLMLPEGWTATPARTPIVLEAEGAERTISFRVAPPEELPEGLYRARAELTTAEAVHGLGFDVVDYPHIAPHHLYRAATARVRVLDVEVADVTVGYVAGAGDGVPEALDQLGVDWAALDAAALAAGDLDRFDVVVTGTRAYEVRDDLVAHNGRLLEWVRDGGTLIVQYNKYPALDRDYAPWPVTIARPHGRVTDEASSVWVLEPASPVFTTPNPIGDEDWEGWVQERGLYFWEDWEGPLTPLVAMSDPGEEPLEGALLIAPLGEGTYVYTGLALFRQLPAGVPGAYRLLANLLSLGAR